MTRISKDLAEAQCDMLEGETVADAIAVAEDEVAEATKYVHSCIFQTIAEKCGIFQDNR